LNLKHRFGRSAFALEQCKTNANRKRLKKLDSLARRDADFSEIAETSTGIFMRNATNIAASETLHGKLR
jgi:hypothetical protein